MIRREFRFQGRVQHVGFRFLSMMLARENHVTGWVRNEYDGTVSMVMQGEEADIDRVLLRLLNDRYIRIDRYDVKCVNVIPEETGFARR